jgi:hypothetical protein
MAENRRSCPGAGAVRREIRVIWRKSDYLNPSLQKVQVFTRRKAHETGAGPCGTMGDERAVILRGAGAMPGQGIQGDGRDA